MLETALVAAGCFAGRTSPASLLPGVLQLQHTVSFLLEKASVGVVNGQQRTHNSYRLGSTPPSLPGCQQCCSSSTQADHTGKPFGIIPGSHGKHDSSFVVLPYARQPPRTWMPPPGVHVRLKSSSTWSPDRHRRQCATSAKSTYDPPSGKELEVIGQDRRVKPMLPQPVHTPPGTINWEDLITRPRTDTKFQVITIQSDGSAQQPMAMKSSKELGLHPRDASLFSQDSRLAPVRATITVRDDSKDRNGAKILFRTEGIRAIVARDKLTLFKDRDDTDPNTMLKPLQTMLETQKDVSFVVNMLEVLLFATTAYFERRKVHLQLMLDLMRQDAKHQRASAEFAVFDNLSESVITQFVPFEKVLVSVINDAKETCEAINRFLEDDELLSSLLLLPPSSASSNICSPQQQQQLVDTGYLRSLSSRFSNQQQQLQNQPSGSGYYQDQRQDQLQSSNRSKPDPQVHTGLYVPGGEVGSDEDVGLTGSSGLILPGMGTMGSGGTNGAVTSNSSSIGSGSSSIGSGGSSSGPGGNAVAGNAGSGAAGNSSTAGASNSAAGASSSSNAKPVERLNSPVSWAEPRRPRGVVMPLIDQRVPGSLGKEMDPVQDEEALVRILETYARELESISGSLVEMQDHLESMREAYRMQLDSKRNQLMQVNLWISMISISVMVVTLVPAFFGMNISHGLEDSKDAFLGVCLASLLLGAASYPFITNLVALILGRSSREGVHQLKQLKMFLTHHLSDLETIINAIQQIEGKVNRKDFATALKAQLATTPVRLKRGTCDFLFDVIDSNRDGFYDTTEAVRRMKRALPALSKQQGGSAGSADVPRLPVEDSYAAGSSSEDDEEEVKAAAATGDDVDKKYTVLDRH